LGWLMGLEPTTTGITISLTQKNPPFKGGKVQMATALSQSASQNWHGSFLYKTTGK